MIGPSGCLLARERGATDDATESGAQAGYGDGPRIFDAIWSPEPDVVHQAACTAISLLDDHGLRRRALDALGPSPVPSSPELRRAAELTNRIVGYVGGPRPPHSADRGPR